MKKPGWMFALWVLSIASQVAAETLRVEALTLIADAAWQRGDANQEQEDGVYLLQRQSPEGPIQLAIPRQPTPVKNGEAVFFEHLHQKWSALYGSAAQIDWQTAAGARWLACTRPSRDGSTRVIQMAAIHAGMAYGLIAFVPRGVSAAPEEILAPVLAGVRFGAPPAPGWRRIRVIPARPEALDQAMEQENARIGSAGMVTGHGANLLMDAEDGAELDWFVEAFEWQKNRQRAPLFLRGRLRAAAPARWDADMAVKAGLDLAPESTRAVEAQTRIWNLCTPRPALDAALAALARGEVGPIAALASQRPAPCPPDAEHPPSYSLITRPGQNNPGRFSLEPPLLPRPAALTELNQAGLAWLSVIGLAPTLSEDAPGRALLARLGVYFVYAPD